MTEDHLLYASEIIAIIEGGLRGDADKVRAYTELMVDKMKQDGFNQGSRNSRITRMIEKRLSGEYLNEPKITSRDIHD